MANAFYPKWKQSLLTEADANASLDQTGANAVHAALVVTSGGYVYNAAHQFYTSLTNVVGTDAEITSPTVANGVYDGNDCVFNSVPAGPAIGAVVLYRKNSGANSTWRLIAYMDTGALGLPITPIGANILITWSGLGIFGV